MGGVFFEDIHRATKDFPYFDMHMQNINYLPHFHNEIEIISVRHGEVDITSENENFTAVQGDISIFMPREIHSFSSKNENHVYVMKIYCKNSVEKTDFSNFRMVHKLAPHGSVLNNVINGLLDRIAIETEKKTVGYTFAVNSLTNKILCEILRSAEIEKVDTSMTKRHLSSLLLLENVNIFVENHYKEPISLTEVAKFCNFSEYYFAHFFKETTGLTFMDFLTSYRLDKALEFLLYSRKNITETSFECGFSNTRAFNRAFKNKFGTTPTQYIKSNISDRK